MSVSISGILLDPFGQPASFAEVKFITWQGANDVLTTAPAVFKTSADGAYSFAVEFGTFTVQVRYNQSNGKFQTIKQKVIVNPDVTATTLGELLQFNEPLTPPEIAYVEQLVAEAEGYRDEAEGFAQSSEGFAQASEASSQTSEGFSQASATSAAESEASSQSSSGYADAAASSAAQAAASAGATTGTPINGGVWAAGIQFNAYNEFMNYLGVPYKPLPTTTLPYTSTATPDLNFVGPFAQLSTANGDWRYSPVFPIASDIVANVQGVAFAEGMTAETRGRLAVGDGMAYRYIIRQNYTPPLRPYDLDLGGGFFAIFDGLLSVSNFECSNMGA